MFTCPRCSVRLVPARKLGTCVWECASCRGRLATVAALRRAFDAAAVRAIWESARGRDTQPGVRCPGCRRAMRAADVRFGGDVSEVDACTGCQFVWLDADEHARLPRAQPRERELSTAARAAVARAELARSRLARPPSGAFRQLGAVFGLPVLADDRPYRTWPLLTWTLALACITASLVAWQYGPLDPSHGGSFGRFSVRACGSAAYFLLATLAHRDVLHLGLNLYFLLVFGGRVEEAIGPKTWCVLFVLAHGAGCLAQSLVAHDTSLSIGASASVAALLAWHALTFPHARVSWWVWTPRWMQLRGTPFAGITLPASVLFVVFGAIHVICAVGGAYELPLAACFAGACVGALLGYAQERWLGTRVDG